MALFPLGRLMITPQAQKFIEGQDLDPILFVIRHGKGEWGDLSEDDKQENEHAVTHGFRIMSAYETPKGRIWVITDADRSQTTVMLPRDY